MLGAIVALVVCATPTSTSTPTATPTATATATATPTSTSIPTDPTAVESANDDSYPPPLPTAPAGPALADVGPLLLSRVARPGGYAVERLIEPSGDIVEHEVNAAGTVQSCRTVGSLHAMPVIAQQAAAGGEYMHVARDASGALVQFVVSRDGEPRAVVVAPAN